MNCPRCGAPVHPQAQQCERCGLFLGMPLEEAPGVPYPYPPPSFGDGYPPANGWEMGGPQAPGPMSIPWAAPPDPFGQPGGMPGQWAPASQFPPGPGNASGQWMPSPDFPAIAPGASGQWDLQPDSNLPVDIGYRGNSLQRMSRPTFDTGGLYPGALLQGGRLRVIAPYGLTRVQSGQGNPPIMQWVASNVERRTRVVLLDLPLGLLPPAEADTVREAIASRMRIISQHPNIQRAFGSFMENGRHFVVLEFVDGEFLSDYVRRSGVLLEDTVLAIGEQLLDALEFLAHQSPPAVHGLINPDTVVITPDGQNAVLTSWSPYAVAKMLNVTLPGPVPLVPGYSAPELLRGQVETRGDVYSVGATLYFAVTGEESTSRSAGIFLPARQYNPDVSSPTEAVLARSLRLVPSQRYQHAEDMLLDIERAGRGESPHRDALDTMEPILPRRAPPMIPAIAITSILLVAVLIAVFILRNRAGLVPTASALPSPTVNPTLTALYSQDEGLSGGEFIFDTSDLPANTTDTASTHSKAGAILAEKAGAAAVDSGNYASAVADFQQAVADDPTNPEARIYLANTQITQSGIKNYVTIAVSVSFSGDDIDVSRQVLRGIALAQSDLNNGGLSNGGKVRIRIASLGPNAAAAPFIQQYFTSQVTANGTNPDHAIGVISWAPKNATLATNKLLLQALQGLAQAHVPVMAPFTSSDAIPPNPYFFQLSPTDKTQGITMAGITMQNFNAHRPLVVIDPSTVGNLEIGGYAAAALQQKLGPAKVMVEKLDGKTVTTDSVAHDAARLGADAILYVGFGDGTIALLQSLSHVGYVPPIFAAPPSDDPVLLGQSTDTEAQFAQTHEQLMKDVTVLSLADPSEWTLAGSNLTTPTFFSEYSNAYTDTGESFTPNASAIFSYDALNLMTKLPVAKNLWTGTQIPTPQNTRDAMSSIKDASAYQGISGRIAFDSQNVPDNRSMLLKGIDISTTLKDASGHPLLVWKPLALIPNAASFCVSSACTPS
jgi:serine/threonine protein kinase